MNITPPVVGTTPGPEWAEQINNIITDQIATHNHQPSQDGGFQLTQDAINITSNFSINNHRLQGVNNIGLTSNVAVPADTNTISDVNGNLYFRDGSGNAIQITAAGAVNVNATGGITGLASSDGRATYGAGVFSWKKTNGDQYATMKNGVIQLFNSNLTNPLYSIAITNAATLGANKTFTLSPENITLPQALPLVTGRVSISSAGVMTSVGTATAQSYTISNVSADATPTNKLTSATYTTYGNKVLFNIEPANAANNMYMVMANATTAANTAINATITLNINGVDVASWGYKEYDPINSSNVGLNINPALTYVWNPNGIAAGTAVPIQLKLSRSTTGTIVQMINAVLSARDI